MRIITRVIAGSFLVGGVFFGTNRAITSFKNDVSHALGEVTNCVLTETTGILGRAAIEVVDEETKPMRDRFAKDVALHMFLPNCPRELHEEILKVDNKKQGHEIASSLHSSQ